jgi:hypothetical protein
MLFNLLLFFNLMILTSLSYPILIIIIIITIIIIHLSYYEIHYFHLYYFITSQIFLGFYSTYLLSQLIIIILIYNAIIFSCHSFLSLIFFLSSVLNYLLLKLDSYKINYLHYHYSNMYLNKVLLIVFVHYLLHN